MEVDILNLDSPLIHPLHRPHAGDVEELGLEFLSLFVTSGIRLGTPAVTTRGMKESDMAQVVDWIDAVIGSPEDEAVIGRVGEAVRARMRDLPLFGE